MYFERQNKVIKAFIFGLAAFTSHKYEVFTIYSQDQDHLCVALNLNLAPFEIPIFPEIRRIVRIQGRCERNLGKSAQCRLMRREEAGWRQKQRSKIS